MERVTTGRHRSGRKALKLLWLQWVSSTDRYAAIDKGQIGLPLTGSRST